MPPVIKLFISSPERNSDAQMFIFILMALLQISFIIYETCSTAVVFMSAMHIDVIDYVTTLTTCNK